LKTPRKVKRIDVETAEEQLQQQINEHASQKTLSFVRDKFTVYASTEQKEKINALTNNVLQKNTIENRNALHMELAKSFETLAQTDLTKFNALRVNAGMTPINVNGPSVLTLATAANELATIVVKEALRRQEALVKGYTEVEKHNKMGDTAGAKELGDILEGALKTKNKDAWDAYIQEQKTRLDAEGKKGLVDSIDAVQQASENAWKSLMNWSPPSTVGKHVVTVPSGQQLVKQAKQIIENVNDSLKKYLADLYTSKKIEGEDAHD